MVCPNCDEVVRVLFKCSICGGKVCRECAVDHYCEEAEDDEE